MNRYFASDGKRYSQAAIDRKRSESYRATYPEGYVVCRGCGGRAEGSSHIVSQKRCKHLHRVELIWDPKNYFPACNSCNRRWENNDKTLLNYNECMEVVKELDPEDYIKRTELR